MNVVYLLGGNVETLNEMSQRIGNQYRWNKEKSNFEVVPVITKDRLAHMSVGEGVVSSQRKNPYLTRYLPFNKYIFYKSMGEPEEPPVQQLAPLHSFSLIGSYEDMKVETEKTPVQEESVDVKTANGQTESITSEDKTTSECEPTKTEKEAITDVDFSDVI